MDANKLLSRMAESLSVHRAFGAIYEREGMSVIGVAIVVGGGGGGEGVSSHGDDDAEHPDEKGPEGRGGGFGGVVYPVGTYVIKNDRVRFVPVVHATPIALASLGLLRGLVGRRRRGSGRRHRSAK